MDEKLTGILNDVESVNIERYRRVDRERQWAAPKQLTQMARYNTGI